jgi:hypothetical protein
MSFDNAVAAIGAHAPSLGGMTAAPAQNLFETALDRSAVPASVQQASIEMRIEPPAVSDGMGGKILDHLETFYGRAQVWQASGATSPSAASPDITGSIDKPAAAAPQPGSGLSGDPAIFDVSHASVMLQRAFAFAIETTLISKASTESTRIFNTFLKGQ